MPKLGATGKFPEQPLAPTDEGEIAFAVGQLDDGVFVDFGTAVQWFGMNPEQARDLGALLIQHAIAAEPNDDGDLTSSHFLLTVAEALPDDVVGWCATRVAANVSSRYPTTVLILDAIDEWNKRGEVEKEAEKDLDKAVAE